MPKYVTTEHFDRAIEDLRQEFNDRFESLDGKFVTKDEFNTRVDQLLVILQRLDHERISELEWKRRMESEMILIKRHVKLA